MAIAETMMYLEKSVYGNGRNEKSAEDRAFFGIRRTTENRAV